MRSFCCPSAGTQSARAGPTAVPKGAVPPQDTQFAAIATLPAQSSACSAEVATELDGHAGLRDGASTWLPVLVDLCEHCLARDGSGNTPAACAAAPAQRAHRAVTRRSTRSSQSAPAGGVGFAAAFVTDLAERCAPPRAMRTTHYRWRRPLQTGENRMLVSGWPCCKVSCSVTQNAQLGRTPSRLTAMTDALHMRSLVCGRSSEGMAPPNVSSGVLRSWTRSWHSTTRLLRGAAPAA